MNFDIEELKIVMNTNIKGTKIPLTSSILYHPDVKDKACLMHYESYKVFKGYDDMLKVSVPSTKVED